jgi:hypothetical protein
MTLYDSLHFRGLHSIDLIVSKLGHRIEDYLDSMLKIMLGITGTAVSCLEHREEISPSVISPLKNVRHMCVDSLTKVCYCIEEISPSVISPLKNVRHMCIDSLTKVCYYWWRIICWWHQGEILLKGQMHGVSFFLNVEDICDVQTCRWNLIFQY